MLYEGHSSIEDFTGVSCGASLRFSLQGPMDLKNYRLPIARLPIEPRHVGDAFYE